MSNFTGSFEEPDVVSAVQTLAHVGELDIILEAMTDGVFIYDVHGYVRKINTAGKLLLATEQLPDYESTQVAERVMLFQPIDEEGRPLSADAWPVSRILRGEELRAASTVDLRVRALDGREIDLGITGAPIRDDSGAITGAVAIMRDVTERRQSERRTHDMLRALLELAEAVVLLPQTGEAQDERREGEDETEEGELEDSLALNGHTEHIEQRDAQHQEKTAERLAGLIQRTLGIERVGIVLLHAETNAITPAAATGLAPAQEAFWRERLPGALLSDLLPDPALRERLHEDEPIVLDAQHPDLRAQTAGLGIRWLLIAPMRLDTHMIGLLLLDAGRFETQHRYSPEMIALAGAAAKLAALVIERERLLTERAEEHAHQMALSDANQRMDEFLAIASHELKSPLTAIKANIQLVLRRIHKEPTTDQEAREARTVAHDLLARTEQQATRLNRLVDDLLDVSRIQAERLALRLEPCDLGALTYEVVEEHRRAEPARELTFSLPLRPVPLVADADRVRQVITNYVTNALKYAPPDRPIAVTVKRTQRWARLAVRDDGPGLPLEEQTRIWQRFHRAPGIEQQGGSGVGLGLGLHISKTIIELLGGHVGVESAVGEGSTFWFTLPLARRQPARPAGASQAAADALQ